MPRSITLILLRLVIRNVASLTEWTTGQSEFDLLCMQELRHLKCRSFLYFNLPSDCFLPASAVLVDYLEFSGTQPAEQKRQRAYTTSLLAVIVEPDGDLQLVELGPRLRSVNASTLGVKHTAFRRSAWREATRFANKQIWEPLLPHVRETITLFFSTDGALARLSLGAIQGKEARKNLIEDHRRAFIPFQQLSPALVNNAGVRQLNRELLLIGDVEKTRVLQRRQPQRASSVVLDNAVFW